MYILLCIYYTLNTIPYINIYVFICIYTFIFVWGSLAGICRDAPKRDSKIETVSRYP